MPHVPRIVATSIVAAGAALCLSAGGAAAATPVVSSAHEVSYSNDAVQLGDAGLLGSAVQSAGVLSQGGPGARPVALPVVAPMPVAVVACWAALAPCWEAC
jgi:hypothetical protein